MAGIVGEEWGELLQQQGEDIRSGAVIIRKLELGDMTITAGQKIVYPSRPFKPVVFVSRESVAAVGHGDNRKKCRGEYRHGDLVCAPPHQRWERRRVA